MVYQSFLCNLMLKQVILMKVCIFQGLHIFGEHFCVDHFILYFSDTHLFLYTLRIVYILIGQVFKVFHIYRPTAFRKDIIASTFIF